MKAKMSDLVNFIRLRDFLSRSVDNLTTKMSREELKLVQAKISLLDKIIIKNSIKLDLSPYVEENVNLNV